MLEKIIKKDKNEILENVLEQKEIDEKTKNLLQGILYKIEDSYKDYKTVKVSLLTRKETLRLSIHVFRLHLPNQLCHRFLSRHNVVQYNGHRQQNLLIIKISSSLIYLSFSRLSL